MNEVRTRIKTAAVVNALREARGLADSYEWSPALDQAIDAAIVKADEAHVCAVEDSAKADRYQKYTEMIAIAKEYYILLAEGESAAALVAELKPKLDILMEPFGDDPAFTAFCQVKRAAAGLS